MSTGSILEYCKTLPHDEASVNPGCICAFAIEAGREKQEAWDEYSKEYSTQMTNLADAIRLWKKKVFDWVEETAKLNQTTSIRDTRHHNKDNELDKNCKDFRQNRFECPKDYHKKGPESVQCTWYKEHIKNWPDKHYVLSVCLTDYEAIWKQAKVLYGRDNFKGETSRDYRDSTWKDVHPVYREAFLLMNKGEREFPYLDISSTGILNFSQDTKLTLEYTIDGRIQQEVTNISCCTNSIVCKDGCSETEFRNILQSCSQEYMTDIETSEKVDIDTSVGQDESSYEVFITENITEIIVVSVLGIILLGVVISVVYYLLNWKSTPVPYQGEYTGRQVIPYKVESDYYPFA